MIAIPSSPSIRNLSTVRPQSPTTRLRKLAPLAIAAVMSFSSCRAANEPLHQDDSSINEDRPISTELQDIDLEEYLLRAQESKEEAEGRRIPILVRIQRNSELISALEDEIQIKNTEISDSELVGLAVDYTKDEHAQTRQELELLTQELYNLEQELLSLNNVAAELSTLLQENTNTTISLELDIASLEHAISG